MAVSSVFVFRSGELRAGSQSSSSQHQAVEQQFHCDFGGIWKQDCVGQSRILTGESTIWRNVLAAPRRFEFVNIRTMVSNLIRRLQIWSDMAITLPLTCSSQNHALQLKSEVHNRFERRPNLTMWMRPWSTVPSVAVAGQLLGRL